MKRKERCDYNRFNSYRFYTHPQKWHLLAVEWINTTRLRFNSGGNPSFFLKFYHTVFRRSSADLGTTALRKV